ncbi:MAG TPA: DUF6069 family protein [Gaiellaceae bacterium]|jgi:hypothetical protein|nr:DUF6069 family protein [Gaiellaceae bacterium]
MHRTRRRLATVVLAPAAALAAWGVVRSIGVDLTVSTGSGTVGAADVVAAATVVSLLAWAVAAQLERRVHSPRRWWAFLTSAGLALSITGPTYLADGGSAVALIGLHFVTAAVVIAGLGGTLPWRGPATSEPVRA